MRKTAHAKFQRGHRSIRSSQTEGGFRDGGYVKILLLMDNRFNNTLDSGLDTFYAFGTATPTPDPQ